MVIQTESHPGFSSGYQMQAAHIASNGGYGYAHGGHAPYMKPTGHLGGGGFNTSTTSDHLSYHGGPAGNVQSYTNFESSKYSSGGQPHLHGGAGYGSSSAAYNHGHGHGGNRMESSSFEYSSSGRPSAFHQEGWKFKSIDD